jgi:23S rRNA pseudouridine2605 synthase
MPSPEKPEGERIAKLLARAGVASRREVERMIADGRIALNGTKLETPATILPHLRGVTVDGKPVASAEPTRLYRFHKPSGLITAERDPAGRPTIYDALRNALPPGSPRLMPIGRLDFSTEGLLLLTNDGGFKREMELPATGVPRTYRARTYGEISQARLEDLMDGIEIEGVRYGPIDANMERRTGRNQWVELTLTEGKNREVRRVLEHLGLEVSRLIRTAYGPFVLGDLAKGQAVEVRKEELERFRSSLKGSSARRGGDRPARPKVDPVPDDRPPRPQRRSSPASATGGAKANRREAPTGGKSRGRSSPSRKGPKA